MIFTAFIWSLIFSVIILVIDVIVSQTIDWTPRVRKRPQYEDDDAPPKPSLFTKIKSKIQNRAKKPNETEEIAKDTDTIDIEHILAEQEEKWRKEQEAERLRIEKQQEKERLLAEKEAKKKQKEQERLMEKERKEKERLEAQEAKEAEKEAKATEKAEKKRAKEAAKDDTIRPTRILVASKHQDMLNNSLKK